MQTNIIEAITDGYRAAKNGTPEDFGKPINPVDHPNRRMLLADDKQFVATRKVADPTWGDMGNVRFAIRGTGPEVARLANEICEHINCRFTGERYDAGIIRFARECVL